MSIVQSIFLNQPGRYNIEGTDIEFREVREGEVPRVPIPESNWLCYAIANVAGSIINTTAFRCLTQLNLHILVHEMGHAFAYKYMRGENSQITIYTNDGGLTRHPPISLPLTLREQTAISLAGPLAEMLFSAVKLALAVALKSYISFPVALVLATGTVLNMCEVLVTNAISVLVNDETSDFGLIGQNGGTSHLMVATAALVGTFALGIFCAVKLW